MFDLYRIFDSAPSSFAQIFDKIFEPCRETLNQRGLTVSGPGLSSHRKSSNMLEQMFESVGGVLYRHPYGTE
jgi:hypothetical protein